MAHEENPLEQLPAKATLTEVIDKVNEIINRINGMWYIADHEK